MHSRPLRLTAISLLLILPLAFPAHIAGSDDDSLKVRMKEFAELLSATAYWSAETPTPDDLVYSSVRGMLKTLDPHSTFLEPRSYSQMRDKQTGSYFGVGLTVGERNKRITVISPMQGSPAARLGVRAGDVIVEIDGLPTEQLTYDEVVRRLKGPKGTSVNIAVRRVGMDDPIPFHITRAAIPTTSISAVVMVRPEVGYVRITDFTYTTGREFDEALARLQRDGMKKLIVDLRGNGGGLLDAALEVSDHFLEKGTMIVYTEGRTKDADQKYLAEGRRRTLNVPVVVMVDHGSASASEIVAGAIQDQDRGLIVGEISWGKGLVQSVYNLQYGAALALTTSKYFTPAGRNIQRDFSSMYDYFVSDPEISHEIPVEQRKVFKTFSGRKVYGSGGITPDVIVKPRELSRILQLIEARGLYFDFGVEYAARHPEVTRELKVTPAMVEEVVKMAAARKIGSVEEVLSAIRLPLDRAYLERAIRAEIIAARFGYEASYPDRVAADDEIARAADLLPEAEKIAAMAATAAAEKIAREGGSKAPVSY